MRFIKSVVIIAIVLFLCLTFTGLIRIVAPYLFKYLFYGFIVVIAYILGRLFYTWILKWGSDK